MRILVVSSTFYPENNGVTITVHDQTLKLMERGHEAHIATRRFHGTPFHEKLDGIHVWRIGPAKFDSLLTRLIFILKLATLVFKLVVNVPFDIIHAYGPTATIVAKMATWRRKLHLVATFTGPDPIWYPSIRKRAPNFFLLFEKSALIIADEITVSTNRNRKWILDFHGEKLRRKIHVVAHGVNLALFKSARKASRSFPTILFVGAVCHRKGTDVLIMAAPKVLEKYPNAKFLFVGEITDFQSKLDKLIQDLGIPHAVAFTGSIKGYENMPRYFEMGDVLVLPSRHGGEGFGRVIIEAMSMGLPVVASRIRGPVDIISHGENGFLVNPEDPKDLAEKIICVLEDKVLAMRLGSEGQRTAREKYDLDSVVMRIEKIFEKAMFSRKN